MSSDNNRTNRNKIDNLKITGMEKKHSKFKPNTGLYIARPKNKIAIVEQANTIDNAIADNTGESLFIAYPKTKIDASSPDGPFNVPLNDVKEGMFICYPKNITPVDAADAISQSKAGYTLKGGYVARPKKSRSGFVKQHILGAPINMIRNNAIILNLLHFLRLKVS